MPLLCAFVFANNGSYAQCPANIDFEEGSFKGWKCWTGSVSVLNNKNVIVLNPVSNPVANRHKMLSLNPGDGNDPFGGFPKNCPNGSGHSIRLGNDSTDNQAEAVSYQFTIPAGQNKFSLVYNYAVVFQNPPHHPEEQPRLEIEVKNLTDNTILDCSSFAFVASGALPGFYMSEVDMGNAPVWCKDWTRNSINLDGNAGKTFQIIFKNADCTLGAHFGYAYIDIDTECSSSVIGANYCPSDTEIELTAPYGYKDYKWYSTTTNGVFGKLQILHLSPPPPPGSTIAVELIPYDGYGCADTIYAQLDTLSASANAGPDKIFCSNSSVQLGDAPKPGLSYKWSPAEGLSNPSTSDPVASPKQTTKYVLTATLDGGTCRVKDTVEVYVPPTPKADFSIQPVCINTTVPLINKTVNNTRFAVNYLWNMGDGQLFTLKDPLFTYKLPGTYNISLTVYTDQCPTATDTKQQSVIVDNPRTPIQYPVKEGVINFPMKISARDFGKDYLWSPAKNLDNPLLSAPIFYGSTDQLYTIQIKTTTGCVTVDTQLVKVHKKIEIYVPSSFTPNGDGLNDYLRPILMGFKKINYFKVYSRWGQLLFNSNTEKPGWDGKSNSIPLSTQVVVWIIEAEDVDGIIHRKQGSSLIMR